MLPSTSMMSDELSEVLSEVGDIGCVVFSSPSSPSCTSPWSNGFEVSGGDCDSGSGSGGSDSEGRGEGAASDESTTMTGERDSQPTTDDDDSYTAASPSSPLPPVESTPKRRRKLTAKQQQQQLTPKPAPTEKGRKRRLTATAAPQYDEAEVPEDKRERNKQSASDYRKRRKLYVASLEQQLNELKAALRVEREEGKKLRGENTVLRASMQMMREFVQGNKNNTTTPAMTATARTEEKEEEGRRRGGGGRGGGDRGGQTMGDGCQRARARRVQAHRTVAEGGTMGGGGCNDSHSQHSQATWSTRHNNSSRQAA